MAIIIDPTVPPDSGEPARQGASRIRGLASAFLQLFGFAGNAAVSIPTAPFTIDNAGNVTVVTTLNVGGPALGSQAANKNYVDSNDIGAGTSTNTGNAYTCVLAPTQFSLVGRPVLVAFNVTNTGAATLNCGNGNLPIVHNGVAILAGQLDTAVYSVLIGNGSSWEILNPLPSRNLATTGHQQFDMGLIVNWATANYTTGGVSVVWDLAFPNAVFGAVVSYQTTPDLGALGVTTTVTGATILGPTSPTVAVFVIALGF